MGLRTTNRAERHASIAKQSSEQSTEWLSSLGMKFIDVQFFKSDGSIVAEPHVSDLTTLPETVRMKMDRDASITHALYPYGGRWCLVCPGAPLLKRIRYYDSQEAATMVARHNG